MECFNLFSNGFQPKNEEVTQEPPDIYLTEQIFDVKFSPIANVIATSLVTGEVKINIYNESENKEVMSFCYHRESCRTVEFSEDGNFLYTGSSDNSIGIISNGELLHQVKNAHESPINTIKYIDNNAVIVTGDDNGKIKLWDFRISSTKAHKLCVGIFSENEDTITDFQMNKEKELLLATSNDGFLGVFDIRCLTSWDPIITQSSTSAPRGKPFLYALSDNLEEELTALCLAKNQKKVIVSTQEGTVLFFSWDWFGDCDDRMTAHPSSIAWMAKYDEDTLITGCDDGYVRAISLLPNKVISVINSDIDAEDCLPISKVAVKGDLLAYVATDEIVRIYDVSSLGTRVVEEYEEPPEREEREEARDEELEEDKDWEEIEGQFDSEGEEDEEEEEEEVARAQMEVEDRGIKWDGNKGNMERKKRENFFKDL